MLVLKVLILSFVFFLSCATSSSLQVKGNERGSVPISEREAEEYRRSVLKCYKTGGSRVVKIEGKLRCFD